MKINLFIGLVFWFLIAEFPIKTNYMQLNAGIITSNLKESKVFYCDKLGFTVIFESDWFILLQAPNSTDRISFLQPNHPSQEPIFQSSFESKGVYFTLEVEDLDEWYQKIKKLGIKIEVEIKEEPWGDRHFSFYDPNGVGLDIVVYSPKQ